MLWRRRWSSAVSCRAPSKWRTRLFNRTEEHQETWYGSLLNWRKAGCRSKVANVVDSWKQLFPWPCNLLPKCYLSFNHAFWPLLGVEAGQRLSSFAELLYMWKVLGINHTWIPQSTSFSECAEFSRPCLRARQHYQWVKDSPLDGLQINCLPSLAKDLMKTYGQAGKMGLWRTLLYCAGKGNGPQKLLINPNPTGDTAIYSVWQMLTAPIDYNPTSGVMVSSRRPHSRPHECLRTQWLLVLGELNSALLTAGRW